MPQSSGGGPAPGPADGALAGADLREHLASQVAALGAGLGHLGEVEPVHDLRVRARRLRSLLRTHQAYLPEAVGDRLVDDVVDDLRWLGRVVGRLRDLDVVAERLSLIRTEESLRHAWLADLRHQRAAELEAATDVLEGPRVATLLRRLTRLLDADGWAATPRPTIGAVLPGQRRKVLSRVKMARALPSRTPEQAEAWHDVRKAAKELRYTAESLAANEPEASRWAAAGRRLQTVLGRQVDRQAVASWLEGFARRHAGDSSLATGSRVRASHERHKASRRQRHARRAAVSRVRKLS